MSINCSKSRTLFYTTVSVIALMAASPQARGAADTPMVVARGPQVYDPGRCLWWGEGGAAQPFGGDAHFGNTGIDGGKTKFGPEGAVGFDCTFGPMPYGPSPWHVSAQVRFGTMDQSRSFNNLPGRFFIPPGTALPGAPSVPRLFNANGAGTLTRREEHGLADFAIGRDVGLGLGQTQLKIGLRIAEIQSKMSGAGLFSVPRIYFATPALPRVQQPFGFVQNSRFVGAGPRAGIDGTFPLGGAWSLDYLGGVAVLYGSRSVDGTGTGAAANANINNLAMSDGAAVFNLDAQGGLSYQLSQSLKVTAGYRFDGYWGALKTTNAFGAVVNEDRFFAGPTLRLTGTTDGLFADPPRPAIIGKAPPLNNNVWTVWGEGSAFATNGGTVHFGDPIDAGKLPSGAEEALGFDMRFGGTPWHVSADVRYGESKRSGTFARNGSINVPSGTPSSRGAGVIAAAVAANGSFTQQEQHELVDFALGRDVGLGIGQTQVKAGLRIADISSKTSGSANFVAPVSFSASVLHPGGPGFVGAAPGAFSFEQKSRFTGGGPRLGIDGTIPLGHGWALDYLGGMAALYGARSLDVTTAGNAVPFGFNSFGVSDNVVLLNIDAQAGLSYWITPGLKVTAGYRFDGYWGALKTIDAAGAVSNEDRFYMGPTVRLTGKF